MVHRNSVTLHFSIGVGQMTSTVPNVDTRSIVNYQEDYTS
ncbi:MAG: hypothetical protein ACI845_000395, partial [Gammaproteobacteria bacterium]